jgi:hypothetical protein
VCALLFVLNCANVSEKNVKSCGIKGYQGHVSSFLQPTRHESGSALQNGKPCPCYSYRSFLIFYKPVNGVNTLSSFGCYNQSNSGYHFRHTFSSIGPTGAKIEAFQNLSFLELNKCTVEHNFTYNENNNLYNLIISRDQIHERFEHSFSSIRAILAELEAFQISTLYEPKNNELSAK